MRTHASQRHSSWHLLVCFLLLSSIHSSIAQIPHPTFEVATVKRAPAQADPNSGNWSPPNVGRFTATHVTLSLLIQLAYGVDKSQIANQPGWFDSNLYDIVAKPEEGVLLSREELKPRLQDLLQQRFHLVLHTETRRAHAYALIAAKGGPHLSPTKADHFSGFRIDVSPGQMRGLNWSMPILAKYLTSATDFPVVDQTGLTGSYDIGFSYEANSTSDNTLPSLSVALKEATGLMLKPQMVPVETILIDSAEQIPAEN